MTLSELLHKVTFEELIPFMFLLKIMIGIWHLIKCTMTIYVIYPR